MRHPTLLKRWRLTAIRPLLMLHYAMVEGRARFGGLSVLLSLRNWSTVPDEWHLVAEFARRYPSEAIRAFALLEERERLRRHLARRGQWIAGILSLIYGLEAGVLLVLQHPVVAALFAVASVAGFAYVLALSRAIRRQQDASTNSRVRPP